MSHITKISLRVLDEAALETAAKACGLERRNQTTHKWYGRFMGDTTPPAGMAVKDYGKCLYAYGLAGDRESYEVGVVKALDGGEGFDLVFDSWGQARLMAAVGGHDWQKLRREYAAEVATRKANAELAREGFAIYRENMPDGRIRLEARRR